MIPLVIRKHCNVCGSWYSLEQFAELTPPAGGSVQHGLVQSEALALRQCPDPCNNTLCVPLLMLDGATASAYVVPVFAGFARAPREEQNSFAWQTLKALIDQETHPVAKEQLRRVAQLLMHGTEYESEVFVPPGDCIHCGERITERAEAHETDAYAGRGGEFVYRECECECGSAEVDPDPGFYHRSVEKAEEERAKMAGALALTKARELLSGKPTNDAIGKASVILMKLNEENNR